MKKPLPSSLGRGFRYQMNYGDRKLQRRNIQRRANVASGKQIALSFLVFSMF